MVLFVVVEGGAVGEDLFDIAVFEDCDAVLFLEFSHSLLKLLREIFLREIFVKFVMGFFFLHCLDPAFRRFAGKQKFEYRFARRAKRRYPSRRN